MLRLCAKGAEPVVWTAADGRTSITFRPLDTIGFEAAQAAARKVLAQLRDSTLSLAEYGLDGGDLVEDGVPKPGLSAFLLSVEYGVASITGWSGIGDERGAPVDPSRHWITALCRDPLLAEIVSSRALARVHTWTDEGNGSASLPAGGAKEGGTIAPIAGNPESPARTDDRATAETSARN